MTEEVKEESSKTIEWQFTSYKEPTHGYINGKKVFTLIPTASPREVSHEFDVVLEVYDHRIRSRVTWIFSFADLNSRIGHSCLHGGKTADCLVTLDHIMESHYRQITEELQRHEYGGSALTDYDLKMKRHPKPEDQVINDKRIYEEEFGKTKKRKNQ